MMVRMKGQADSSTIKEVEPRDLVTYWLREMLQRKESWFRSLGAWTCPSEMELTEAGGSLRGTESGFSNTDPWCSSLGCHLISL